MISPQPADYGKCLYCTNPECDYRCYHVCHTDREPLLLRWEICEMKIRELKLIVGYDDVLSIEDGEEWEQTLRKLLSCHGSWEVKNEFPKVFYLSFENAYGYSIGEDEATERPYSVAELPSVFEWVDYDEVDKIIFTRSSDLELTEELLDLDVKEAFDKHNSLFWDNCDEHLAPETWKQLVEVKTIEKPGNLK